jgi:hypothetical protein
MAQSNTKLQEMCEAQLEKLAQDPRNRVYKWVQSAPVQDPMTPEEIKASFLELVDEARKRRETTHPNTGNVVRDCLGAIEHFSNLPKWQRFATNSPNFFEAACDCETTEKHVKAFLHMWNLNLMARTGRLSDEDAQNLYTAYMWREFGTLDTPLSRNA